MFGPLAPAFSCKFCSLDIRQVHPKMKKQSLSITPMPMEYQIKFCSSQNISRALQHSSVAPFFLTT